MEKSSADKWELLDALYQHGTNARTLKKYLPKWNVTEIEMTANKHRRRVVRKVEDSSKYHSLGHWHELTQNLHHLQGTDNKTKRVKGMRHVKEPKNMRDHVPALSKVMMYAACFEDHPEPQGPQDPNYSEIYRYLAQLLEGSEPTRLSPGSAAKFLEMLQRIKEVVMQPDRHQLQREYYMNSPSLSPTCLAPKDADNKSLDTSSTRLDSMTVEDASFFQDVEDIGPEPSHDDAYYELKKEKMMKQFQVRQRQFGAQVQQVPGMNPLALPTHLLVTPSSVLTCDTTPSTQDPEPPATQATGPTIPEVCLETDAISLPPPQPAPKHTITHNFGLPSATFGSLKDTPPTFNMRL